MDAEIMEGTTETIFEYIKREETAFQNDRGVPVIDGWDFKMHEHIRTTVLYKYGQLAERIKTGNDPVINIILPILNVAYRAEDINVKDIVPYVDSSDNQHLSLIVKKYHDKWARREDFDMDEFLDELKESRVDFGLVLIKRGGGQPEVVPLQRLAFCDQTDILSGPICEKHQFTPEQLQEMKGRWNNEAIDEAIVMATAEKAQQQVKAQKQKTPSKYIEVYELHGVLPETFNPDIENPNPDKYDRHAYYVTYYKGQDKDHQAGIILYHGPEKKNIYKAKKRDKIYGRACGYGGVEELIEPQVWHTYSAIQKKEMLDVAALMIVKSTDAGLAKGQRITDLEKGEVLEVEEGKDASQLFIQPINWAVFDDWQEQMKLTAQTQGSANDPQLGVEPKSGTPFALQRLTTVQGQGIHKYRQGTMATFVNELYREWFLDDMVREMNKGDKWMDEFTLDELKYIAERISKNRTEKEKKKRILRGQPISQVEMDIYKEKLKQQILDKGTDQEIEIKKDDFKDIPLRVKINVADKQKDMGAEVNKIFGFISAIMSTGGQILQMPGMDDLLNQVIEYLGLNPVDFSSFRQPAQSEAPVKAPTAAPVPALAG